MESILIGIYSRDYEYGKALGEALGACCRSLLVTLIEKDMACRDFNNEAFDLILFDEDLRRDIFAEDNGILLLEKVPAAENWETPGSFQLYKYQNIQQFSQKLLFAYWALTGRKVAKFGGYDSEILAFWSAEGGCGCTTVAMAAAGCLKRYYGKKVIYLSLEPIESTGMYLKEADSRNNLNAYLYYLLEKKNGSPPLEAFLMETNLGVSVFKPSKGGRNPLLALKEEHVPLFFNALAGEFDYLVVDGGSNLEFIALWILESCSRGCLVAAREETGIKETRLCDYVTGSLGEEWHGKMVHLRNRQPYGVDNVWEGTLIIHEDADSLGFREGIRHVDIDRDLGADISSILLELT